MFGHVDVLSFARLLVAQLYSPPPVSGEGFLYGYERSGVSIMPICLGDAPYLPQLPETMPERRQKILMVSPELFVHMCKQAGKRTVQIIDNPLPADARCVGVVHDWDRNCFGIVIESSEFPILGETERMDILPAVVFHVAQETE